MNRTKLSANPYLLLAFFTLLNVLNFVDRQLIGTLAPVLIEDLGLSRAEIGLLYGFVFVVFYTLMGLLLGTVADRWHRPRLIACGLAVWSLLTAASGAAMSFLHLAAARVLIGVGEATLTPASMSMLSDIFPAKRRALASGIYYIGVPLGTGLSIMVPGWVVPRYGWRVCFVALGLVGLIFIPLLLMMKNPRRGGMDESAAAPVTETARPDSPGQSFGTLVGTLARSLVRCPALSLAILGAVIINFYAASLIHVITWLNQERGFDYSSATYFAGSIYMCAGITGVTLGGWASDWCHRRWQGGRLWFLVFEVLLFGPFTLAFFMMPPDSIWFAPAWFITGLGATLWFGPTFATVQDLAPARIRATIVAFLLLSLSLLGTGPGAWITGLIGDAHSLERGLVVAVCVGILGSVPLALAARRYSRDLALVRGD